MLGVVDYQYRIGNQPFVSFATMLFEQTKFFMATHAQIADKTALDITLKIATKY